MTVLYSISATTSTSPFGERVYTSPALLRARHRGKRRERRRRHSTILSLRVYHHRHNHARNDGNANVHSLRVSLAKYSRVRSFSLYQLVRLQSSQTQNSAPEEVNRNCNLELVTTNEQMVVLSVGYV